MCQPCPVLPLTYYLVPFPLPQLRSSYVIGQISYDHHRAAPICDLSCGCTCLLLLLLVLLLVPCVLAVICGVKQQPACHTAVATEQLKDFTIPPQEASRDSMYDNSREEYETHHYLNLKVMININ